MPGGLMKRIILMHMENITHHLSNLTIHPQRVKHSGIMQALIFITLNYRKDRMGNPILIIPNLSFKEVHSYASFVLIRLE
jgi:hypothetical protein